MLVRAYYTAIVIISVTLPTFLIDMDILRRSWQEWGKVEDATYPYHSTTGEPSSSKKDGATTERWKKNATFVGRVLKEKKRKTHVTEAAN